MLVVTALITGLGLGSIYILVALSYTLVLATSGVFIPMRRHALMRSRSSE